jgi:hypothetical protein
MPRAIIRMSDAVALGPHGAHVGLRRRRPLIPIPDQSIALSPSPWPVLQHRLRFAFAYPVDLERE